MPRQAFPPDDLRCYRDEDTLTVAQTSVVLDMDKRVIRGLVHAGVLRIQADRKREMHVYASSIRAFLRWLDSQQRQPA